MVYLRYTSLLYMCSIAMCAVMYNMSAFAGEAEHKRLAPMTMTGALDCSLELSPSLSEKDSKRIAHCGSRKGTHRKFNEDRYLINEGR